MSLRKKAKLESPHATFVAGDWEWRVLKVYAPKAGWGRQYATWFIAAKSPYTADRWEYGDIYIVDILMQHPTCSQQTPEFKEYLK